MKLPRLGAGVVTFLSISASLIFVFIGIFFILDNLDQKRSNKLREDCKGISWVIKSLDEKDIFDVVDCYGIISIHDIHDDGYSYSVSDSLNRNNSIYFRILDDIILVDNLLYVKSNILGYSQTLSDNLYHFNYFDGTGEIKTITVKSLDEFPHYLIVNTKTGAVSPYYNTSTFPEDVRDKFSK